MITKGGACSRCCAGPYLCSSTCDLTGRSRRRAISRKVVMRWRGVSVMSREGQLLSQKPHSMQRFTMAEAGGEGFRCFTCRSGSCRPEKAIKLLMRAYAEHSRTTSWCSADPQPPPSTSLHKAVLEATRCQDGSDKSEYLDKLQALTLFRTTPGLST